MKTYHFEIYARLTGALGVNDRYTVTVQADNLEAAKLRLYETHEHISILSYREEA